MNLEISSSLKFICNVLKEKTECEPHQRSEIIAILKTLNVHERCLVAKYFCKLPWNIGSLHILSILQELRILTATEYVLCLENTEEIQLILNDFLESEFELITNLQINSTFDSGNSIRLNFLLDESLESLLKDLMVKHELNNLEFLKHMSAKLSGDILLKIIHKHLDVILKLHKSNAKEAFNSFSTWINEGVDDLKFPKDLHEKLLLNYTEEALNYLLKLSSAENFREWKFYLIMFQTICSISCQKAGPYVRKYLKLRLKQCATVPCKRSMMHILLTARASNAITTSISKNLDYYADWYKKNIGEMKFSLKDDEFQNVLSLLDQCIVYEMEEDYLEIHATISISPPVLCGKLIQTYKSKCKQRLQQIKKGFKQIENINESIIIEDSN